MNVDLQPIEEQVIVITGASSGIGLTTARMAAERGATVVAAARSDDALEELVEEIEADGGDATYVVADVSDCEDVQSIAETAREEYDGFDTWVNVAAQFVYGRLDETPVEDMREQFEVNVWGTVYGSLEAAEHLEDDGGAIINIGSVASDRAIPLQGSYSASKQAVKAFTDTLRMELEDEGAQVSVTLVKPDAVDTPYTEHARNYMDEEPDLPSPVYAPEEVARAILNAAEEPRRDVYVGGAAKLTSTLEDIAPRVLDLLMERSFFEEQKRDEPARRDEPDAMEAPVGDLEERGSYEGHVAERSLYTTVSQNRELVGAAVVGLAAGVLTYARRKARRERERRQPETRRQRVRRRTIDTGRRARQTLFD